MIENLDARQSELTNQWQRLDRLHTNIEHALSLALQHQHQLGLSDFRALQEISNSPDGELRLQELAEVLNLNQSSVSRLVGRLDTAGLTVRDVCAGDRRGVYSVITPLGRRRFANALPTFESTLQSALSEATADPELCDLITALNPGSRI